MLVMTRSVMPEGADEETRKRSSIKIGPDIIVTILEVHGQKVRLGVTAPKHVIVDRAEVSDKRAKDRSSWEKLFRSAGVDEDAERIAVSVPKL